MRVFTCCARFISGACSLGADVGDSVAARGARVCRPQPQSVAVDHRTWLSPDLAAPQVDHNQSRSVPHEDVGCGKHMVASTPCVAARPQVVACGDAMSFDQVYGCG